MYPNLSINASSGEFGYGMFFDWMLLLLLLMCAFAVAMDGGDVPQGTLLSCTMWKIILY